ncbi:hypothetical protein D9611_013347 [Ephemerocybe angulata]|uniref:Ferric oxidoreductase domain-containing protein n=1 Tax=Ephemerocybe angulata TaxID=980116 RepID=A0A8H5CBG1_9AGAR|nr:hypothetical protein D9611_013347 [Tulosesus angulatus]
MVLSRHSWSTLHLLPLSLSVLFSTAAANYGHGIMGVTRTLYAHTECAHACSQLLEGSQLTCATMLPGDTPKPPLEKRQLAALNPVECYLINDAYLRTLALCVSDYCPSDLRLPKREEWWEKNVAPASAGPWSPSLIPAISYDAALHQAREEIAKVGEANVPVYQLGAPLNRTSRIPESLYTPNYNSWIFFEGYKGQDGRNAVGVAISTICIPLLFSFVRLLPGRPFWYSQLEIALQKPVIGRRHRSPMVGNVGLMPTRGQSLYIAYILISQIFLSIFPILTVYPNDYWPDRQVMLMIGDRTGDLAMANFVAVFLFSSRNNILLWMTNWSHSTFLLLHRWISYCLIIEVSLHSLLLLIYYWSIRAARQQELMWIWGIVGTMAFVLLWPASLLPVRQRAYEFFLAFHQIFSAIGLIGTFFHIYKFYKYDWGFEIWVYIGGIIWFLDRLVRLLRVLSNGIRTANVTALDSDAEYIQIDIDGVVWHGHVYLSFPTISWRFWENHPYSVLSASTGHAHPKTSKAESYSDSSVENKESESEGSSMVSSTGHHVPIQPRTTILLRSMQGLTRTLAARLLAVSADAGGRRRIALPVLVESSYHANPAMHDLIHCSTLLCIAGGVGVTAVLPIMRSFEGAKIRLAWGMRNECLIPVVEPQLRELRRNPAVQIETCVGERLQLLDLLKEEIEKEGEGALGIVVCGPTGMADEVRFAVAELVSQAKRAVVFVDEAFSW